MMSQCLIRTIWPLQVTSFLISFTFILYLQQVVFSIALQVGYNIFYWSDFFSVKIDGRNVLYGCSFNLYWHLSWNGWSSSSLMLLWFLCTVFYCTWHHELFHFPLLVPLCGKVTTQYHTISFVISLEFLQSYPVLYLVPILTDFSHLLKFNILSPMTSLKQASPWGGLKHFPFILMMCSLFLTSDIRLTDLPTFLSLWTS